MGHHHDAAVLAAGLRRVPLLVASRSVLQRLPHQQVAAVGETFTPGPDPTN